MMNFKDFIQIKEADAPQTQPAQPQPAQPQPAQAQPQQAQAQPKQQSQQQSQQQTQTNPAQYISQAIALLGKLPKNQLSQIKQLFDQAYKQAGGV